MPARYVYANDLVEDLKRDDALRERTRQDPLSLAPLVAPSPLATDVWIYRLVVITLGVALLGSTLLGFIAWQSAKALPEFLVAVGSGSLGALAGLLAPSPAARQG